MAPATPVPSLKPQRPSRLEPPGFSVDIPSWISSRLRATPQMRTSSIVPLKKPCV
jgi:hypothetical protein